MDKRRKARYNKKELWKDQQWDKTAEWHTKKSDTVRSAAAWFMKTKRHFPVQTGIADLHYGKQEISILRRSVLN